MDASFFQAFDMNAFRYDRFLRTDGHFDRAQLREDLSKDQELLAFLNFGQTEKAFTFLFDEKGVSNEEALQYLYAIIRKNPELQESSENVAIEVIEKRVGPLATKSERVEFLRRALTQSDRISQALIGHLELCLEPDLSKAEPDHLHYFFLSCLRNERHGALQMLKKQPNFQTMGFHSAKNFEAFLKAYKGTTWQKEQLEELVGLQKIDLTTELSGAGHLSLDCSTGCQFLVWYHSDTLFGDMLDFFPRFDDDTYTLLSEMCAGKPRFEELLNQHKEEAQIDGSGVKG